MERTEFHGKEKAMQPRTYILVAVMAPYALKEFIKGFPLRCFL